mmetsp:Transcript_21978/g.48246  ORF Transcript_21978/g.48246 Transcript_21978/m.48246 type:complete len:378 (-) Transcript_21978:114-1247(-)
MCNRSVSWAVIVLLLAQLVSHSESAGNKFFGNVDDPEALKTAVNVAGLDGNVVLVAVGGAPQHLLTALNLIHNLRHRGRSDNVLLLTSSERDCRFIAAQHIVPVRVCTWSDKLSKPSDWWAQLDNSKGATRLWHLRLHFFAQVLELVPSVGLLMTDTDVCFSDNPFPYLEGLNMTVVLNGTPDAINIGLMYARKAPDIPDDGTLRLFSEIDRRLAAFRLAGQNTDRVTGARNGQVMWDQAVVNDVYHQLITGNKTYFRSCWLGFGAKGDNSECFSECCDTPHPFGLRPGSQQEEDSMAHFIARTLKPLFRSVPEDKVNRLLGGVSSVTRPRMVVQGLGVCGNYPPMEHENQCHRAGVQKLDWMKDKGCWESRLDALL